MLFTQVANCLWGLVCGLVAGLIGNRSNVSSIGPLLSLLRRLLRLHCLLLPNHHSRLSLPWRQLLRLTQRSQAALILDMANLILFILLSNA